MTTQMHILLTGATGFVGSHLLPRLLERGHRVTCLSRNVDEAKKLSWCNGVEFVQHDIASNSEDLFENFGHVDAVAHLAWPGLPHYRELSHFEHNLPQSYCFLSKLVKSGCKKVLVTGTCFEYGMKNGCLAEEVACEPANPYGIAKNCLRIFLQSLQVSIDFQLCWGRLFYVHGIRQNPRSLTSQLQSALDASKVTFPMSGGEQLRDFLPVGLAAQYLADLLESREDIGVVNICSGRPTSVRGFVEKWLVEQEKKIELQFGAIPYSDLEPFAFWGCTKKLKRLVSNNDK